MLFNAKEIALYAQQNIEEVVYRPADTTQANRQGILDILAVHALPYGNKRFKAAVDGLIGMSISSQSITLLH